ILIATDNHIGYMEKDPVRGRDSINTFKEILEIGREKDVDFVLLAGDLFHENKPSSSSLWQVMSLLREYSFNSRPVSVELLSDAGVGITSEFSFPPINYEDQNLNVGLPIFSIHGNHDDPQGAGPEGALCALDLLSAAGVINYFGRLELPGTAVDDAAALQSGIRLKPILLQKGKSKLAMYGIGNIRDERFHYEMKNGRISMFRPQEGADEYFNLVLIHQNRVPRGPGNFVPENGFGDEVDLIIWGHEHDNRIQPEPVAGKNYHISQPGSSIATSLAEGEAGDKQVAILTIRGSDFQIQPITLKTVRPFVIDNVVLSWEEEENGLD
ncbi:Metallo-dependent phosphatase, partial [Atractiella rhizophila]